MDAILLAGLAAYIDYDKMLNNQYVKSHSIYYNNDEYDDKRTQKENNYYKNDDYLDRYNCIINNNDAISFKSTLFIYVFVIFIIIIIIFIFLCLLCIVAGCASSAWYGKYGIIHIKETYAVNNTSNDFVL